MTTYPAKIITALYNVMESCGYVQKQGRNDFHKYNYAGELHLLEVLRPAMLKHGLLLIPSCESCSAVDEYGNVFVTVEYTLAHKDGDVWPKPIKMIGAGNDKNKSGGTGDKGVYKAITGANKYMLFKLFQIATGDDPEVPNGLESVKDPIREDAPKSEPKAEPARRGRPPKSEEERADPLAASWALKEKDPEAFAEKFVKKMAAAPSAKAADKLANDNKTMLDKITDDLYQTCTDAYAKKLAEFGQDTGAK